MTQEFRSRPINIKDRVVEGALPEYLHTNTNLINILKTYYDSTDVTDSGIVSKIQDLIKQRDPDFSNFKDVLRKEIGARFPNFGTMDEATFLKTLHFFHAMKGSNQAIEGYFRIFLNTDVELEYPQEQMLRVSDGKWDADESRWTNADGLLSESQRVIQDSFRYQVYSYVIKSGVATVDYEQAYKELAHPAGWIFFGEVVLLGEAFFEVDNKSPTIVPGFQAADIPPFLIESNASHVIAMPTPEKIKKIFGGAVDSRGTFSLKSYAPFLAQTWSIDYLSNYTIEEMEADDTYVNEMPPATIIIS